MNVLRDGLWNAFQMGWEVTWALVLGFLLSAVVQAWVPRERMRQALGGADLRTVSLATGLGAASSSCSYAAVAIAKSMFQKGASLVSAMVFQFASTNLVFELGIVMWIFLGWHFTLAELVGGLVLIVLLWGLLRLTVTRRREEESREHAIAAENGHHHAHGRSWSAVAHYFVTDWKMLWKEIVGGFLISGFVALVPAGVFDALFLKDAPGFPRLLVNVVVGPLVAVASFVCSVGNIPLGAVLWARGISFGGVLAFVFADLLIVPLVLIYRRYYGGRMTVRLVAVMFAATVAAALVVDGIFSVAGLVPETRPDVDSITSRGVTWNYTTVLDIIFLVIAAVLVGMTRRRGERRVHRLEGGHAH